MICKLILATAKSAEAFSYPFIDQAFTKNFFISFQQSKRRQLAVGFGQCQRFIHAWGSHEKRPRVGKKKNSSLLFFSNQKNREIWPLTQKRGTNLAY